MRRPPQHTAAPLVLVALLAGCGGSGAEPPGEAAVELGTGEWEMLPITDGQDVELIHGAQGGYHVWASIRADGIEPEDVILEVETQPADESLPPEKSRVQVDFDRDPDTGEAVFIGWPAILSQPGCVVDRMLRLQVTLTDRRGAAGMDERYVVPRAGVGGDPPPCE